MQARHIEYDYDENDEVDEDEDKPEHLEPKEVDDPTLLVSKRGQPLVDLTNLEWDTLDDDTDDDDGLPIFLLVFILVVTNYPVPRRIALP